MSGWVTVGRVGRPHGLDGHVIVERPSDDPDRFAPGATVWVGHEPARVVSAKRVGGGRLAVRFDREPLRGAPIELPRSQLPEPAEGEYYVFQLVGLEVVEAGGRALGRVGGVTPGIANDVLDLEGGLALPLVEECVLDVDLDAGRITVAEGFAE